MSITLTNKQEKGLRIAVQRFRDGAPYTVISGYAGSGKSTLVKFIIEALDIDPEDVAYVTFTGKAASVLRRKGCPNAMTAHKLLYYSKRMPNGKFTFKPRATLEGDYSLIVVDEISMLPNDLWELLLSHKKHIIALGDPGQLPPISKNADNHVLDTPHIFLDEIMRQAQESEIIRLTMDIRAGKTIRPQKGNEVMVINSNEVVDGMYSWGDQIICATNKKRQEINNYMRAAAGRGVEPEPGDKVICLVNRWNTLDVSGENALVNGCIGVLGEFQKGMQNYPIYNFPRVPVLYSTVLSESDGIFEDVIIDYHALKDGKPFLSSEDSYKIWKSQAARPYEPIEFNYGYAITGWKAQGSEWNKVLAFEENFPFDKETHIKFLYTVATRASEKLVLVKS